jgi:Protein of unknown function (DUF3768).
MTSNEYYGYTKEVHELAEHYLKSYIIINQNHLVDSVLKQEGSNLGIEIDNIVNLYDEDEEIQEVLEWWLVDRWLADQLEQIGEPVLHADCGDYWGRTCSGQSIILDGTLQKIAQQFLEPDNEVDAKTKRIAQLNDECRKTVMMPIFGKRPCRVMLTQGISSLSPEDQVLICAKVRDFKDFSEGDNPYGERDFGAFDFKGQKIFWKIDCYDNNLAFGSEDPSDPKQTTRVLTILLASEY